MPKTVIVTYKTTADRADENEGLVRQISGELTATAPDGVRYTALRPGDGVSFTRIAAIEALDGPNPILTLPAFARFQEKLAQRCEEPPAGQSATAVGSYPATAPDSAC